VSRPALPARRLAPPNGVPRPGKCSGNFYVRGATYHREGNAKTVDAKIAVNYSQLKRPSQFNFIYKANDDQIARAQGKIADLLKDQLALLARRQKHEDDQSRLWATLAWEQVKDQEIEYRPLYRFALKPEAGLESADLRPMVLFVRTAAAVASDGVESITVSQGGTFTAGEHRMAAAYAALQKSLADVPGGEGLKPEHAKDLQLLKSLCKELAEQCKVTADDYANALDRDQAREDSSKLEFRGQLQQSLTRFTSEFATLADGVSQTAREWAVEEIRGTPSPDVVPPSPPVEARGHDVSASAGVTPPLHGPADDSGAAITIVTPDPVKILELKAGEPRLYDSKPLRTIESFDSNLSGWKFTSIPQRIVNSYEIIINSDGTLYVFGNPGKSKAAPAEAIFGEEAKLWQSADGAIQGVNVKWCYKRHVSKGERISLKGFEMQLAAKSIEKR